MWIIDRTSTHLNNIYLKTPIVNVYIILNFQN